MAYRNNRSTRSTTKRTTRSRRTASSTRTKRMSATRRATEAAFKRGVKSGMRMRRSNSRRAYFYG